jgi:hypothetical protein
LDRFTKSGELREKIEKKIHKFWPCIFLLAAAIRTLPLPASVPTVSLDSSWAIGLNMAFLNNMQFGKDIIFTLGPLGFLWAPLVSNYDLWRISLAYNIFIHMLLFISIFLLLQKYSAKWYHYLLASLALYFLTPGSDFEVWISTIVFIFIIATGERSDWKEMAGLVCIGIILATVSLIKFNLLIVSIIIILATLISFLLTKKEIRLWAYFTISYVIALPIIWVLAGQKLQNFYSFIISGLNIAGGYNDAMTYGGLWSLFYPLVITLIVALLVFIFAILKKQKEVLVFFILGAGVLASAYKQGYIRNDLHVLNFFYVFGLFFAILTLIIIMRCKSNLGKAIGALTFLMVIYLLFCCLFSIQVDTYGISDKISEYSSITNFLSDERSFNYQVDTYKNSSRRFYLLDNNTLQLIDNRTIDIFPWDIALTWSYGLNWSPRPIFQSYSAYTNYLDTINSRHFMGNNAPDRLIYYFKTIDGRYALFDEPETFRTILSNYRYVSGTKQYTLLAKNNTDDAAPEVSLSTIEGKMGQNIDVPRYDDGYVYGRITMERSILGKIKSILYKPGNIYIKFLLSNDTYTKKYKLIPGIMGDGIFLSGYASSMEDLTMIFKGKITKSIKAIVIDSQNPWENDDNIAVEFFGVPSNIINNSET